MNDRPFLSKISFWLVSVLTTLVILMLSVRILITPLFAQIEYRLPNFPEDPFGFNLEDRLRWSEPSIKYLVNAEDIGYLESLQFEDGEPIYNADELSHMEDVKSVVTGMRIAMILSLVILFFIALYHLKIGKAKIIYQALNRGGWGVIGLITAILIFIAVSFNQLFTWFHHIFFESGTWQFLTSDTLIRLFPMRFWRDAFIFVGLLSVIFGILIILITHKRAMSNKF